jgi:hypothetical protein
MRDLGSICRGVLMRNRDSPVGVSLQYTCYSLLKVYTGKKIETPFYFCAQVREVEKQISVRESYNL